MYGHVDDDANVDEVDDDVDDDDDHHVDDDDDHDDDGNDDDDDDDDDGDDDDDDDVGVGEDEDEDEDDDDDDDYEEEEEEEDGDGEDEDDDHRLGHSTPCDWFLLDTITLPPNLFISGVLSTGVATPVATPHSVARFGILRVKTSPSFFADFVVEYCRCL